MLLGIDRSRDALAIENLKHARTPGVFGTVYPWCRVPAVKAHTIEERDESVVVVFAFFRSLHERHPFQRVPSTPLPIAAYIAYFWIRRNNTSVGSNAVVARRSGCPN